MNKIGIGSFAVVLIVALVGLPLPAAPASNATTPAATGSDFAGTCTGTLISREAQSGRVRFEDDITVTFTGDKADISTKKGRRWSSPVRVKNEEIGVRFSNRLFDVNSPKPV